MRRVHIRHNPDLTQAILAASCAIFLVGQSQPPPVGPAWAPERAQARELPTQTTPELASLRPPIQQPEIPAVFFGCWEGSPKGFDSVGSDLATYSLSKLERVVFCYRTNEIYVPEIDISLTPRKSVLNLILGHLGLGYTRSRVVDVKADVYKISTSQIHSRTTVTLEVTESWIYKLPSTRLQRVTDEELATLINPTCVFINGRQFLAGSGRRGVGSWHAYFHRW